MIRASLIATVLLAATHAHAKVNVVATLPSLGAIAREVGGDAIDVDVLATATEDPHFVDPKPSLVLKLNKADLLVQNGLDLEVGWLPKLQVQARNAKIAPGGVGVIDASTLVERLDVLGRVDRAMGDVHPGGNPHFLFDPRRAAKIGVAVAERVAALDPANADAVRARGQQFAARMEAVAAKARAAVQTLPAEKRRVVAYHRSLTYLEDALGLEEVATVEPKPGVPPDPGHVAAVLATLKRTKAPAILQEEFYPSTTAKTLAELSGAKLVVLPGGARFAQNETYSAHIEKLLTEVARALGA